MECSEWLDVCTIFGMLMHHACIQRFIYTLLSCMSQCPHYTESWWPNKASCTSRQFEWTCQWDWTAVPIIWLWWFGCANTISKDLENTMMVYWFSTSIPYFHEFPAVCEYGLHGLDWGLTEMKLLIAGTIKNSEMDMSACARLVLMMKCSIYWCMKWWVKNVLNLHDLSWEIDETSTDSSIVASIDMYYRHTLGGVSIWCHQSLIS